MSPEAARPEIGGTAVAHGIATNYLAEGDGPPVMLLHGSGPGVTAYANWRLTIPALAARLRVVAPDLVGFGYTERPADVTYDMDTWVSQAVGLLDALGIEKILCVTGGSMGGMQALQWAASYPERVVSAVPIACAAKHSAQNIAFHEVGRQAIMADPDWHGGAYQLRGTQPSKGLAVARMAAHITYLSEAALQRKFGRSLQNPGGISFAFAPDFQVESYLHHQGLTFVDRFDANSYLYITRAMDYFDLAADHGGVLAEAFRGSKTRFCIISFTSDWLFPTVENKRIAHALNAAAATVSFVEIETDRGHDAFLLDEPEMFETVRGFLNSVAAGQGVA